MITALVLAAGESKRTAPFLKPLMPMGGKTVIEVILEKLKKSSVDLTLVVLGHEAGRIEASIKGTEVGIVLNREYREGMLSSVKLGVTFEDSDFLIFPVDHPLVEVKTIDLLIYNRDENRIVVPTYRGKRGHPILIPSPLAEELIRFRGRTLRDFVHERQIKEVEVDDEGVIINLNTPEDFRKYLEYG